MSEMSARAAQGGGRVAAEQVAKIAVPENLAAIIEHYIAKLENDQRTVLVGGRRLRRPVPRRHDRGRARAGRRLGWRHLRPSSRASSYGSSPRVPRKAATTQQSPYSFRHALFRQVLYERTSPSARAQLHRKIGAALERERATAVPVTAAELATHFERGGEATAAVRYYAEAAEAALAHFSPEECMRIIERASRAARAGAGWSRAQRTANHRSQRFTVSPPPECLAPAAKQRARSSERTRCSTKRRSIRCERACCTDSDSCFACAPNMPRRSRWPIARKRSDRRRTIRVLLSTACTVHGQVDQLQGRSRAARTWLERGLALSERLDVGPGEFLVDPQVALLGDARRPAPSSWLGRASAQPACSAHLPALAIGDGRWRGSSRSGTARCSRCDSATPSAWPLSPMRCTRSSTNSRSRMVERRVAGFAAGPTPEWVHRATAINGFGTRTKTTCALECSRAQARSWAMRPRRCSSQATSTERRRQLEEALQIADKLGERVYLPQLYLLEAAIARARGERTVADGLGSTRDRGGQSAGGAVARVDGADRALRPRGRATPQTDSALATLVDQMPDASDTDAVTRARTLLAK